MPVGFFYAPPLFQHNGVTIFGVYINDNSNRKLRKGTYGWSKYSSDEGQDTFNVNELPNYREGIDVHDLLKEAIDQGYITNKGIVRNWNQNVDVAI